MFVVKNAWQSVTRNKGRNILIIVIVTIIAAAATIGLSIRQAATTARNSGLENTTITAQISLDRQATLAQRLSEIRQGLIFREIHVLYRNRGACRNR